MGFYVLIRKETEDADTVTYLYGPDEQTSGRLCVSKRSGLTAEITPLAGDDAKHFFMRATVKVRQAWKQGNFPDTTSWSS